MIIVPIIPPFTELSVNQFLDVYRNTVRHYLPRSVKKRDKTKFRNQMLYYGTHSTSPIKISYNFGEYDVAKNYKGVTFVECPLSESDKPAIERFVTEHHGDVENLLEDVLSGKYKISIGFYEEQESYAAYLQPVGEDHRNSGMMLSAWSDNPIEALFLVSFKHLVKFDGRGWKAPEKKGRWG